MDVGKALSHVLSNFEAGSPVEWLCSSRTRTMDEVEEVSIGLVIEVN